jgi:PhzF family phenazine biosynthesis protein
MKIPIYQVDAFTSRVFGGNPAAVCPLESWLDDGTLQAIATENNLSETAFFVGGGGKYEIRWMTPAAEVDLCGHATLASAWVIMNRLDRGRREVVFGSRSGPLTVVRQGDDLLALDFPARPPEPVADARAVGEALGRAPRQLLAARDYLAVYDSEEEVRALRPDMARIAALDRHAVIASSPGRSCDFVSRFFAPAWGVPEDPVTGSSHCTLVPYWAGRLGTDRLRALQVSPRGGELFCELRGPRVLIAGRAVPFMEGLIEIS